MGRKGRRFVQRIKKKVVVQGSLVLMVVTMVFVGGVKMGEKVEYRWLGNPTSVRMTAQAPAALPTYTMTPTRTPFPTLGSYPGPGSTAPYPAPVSVTPTLISVTMTATEAAPYPEVYP